MSAPKADIAPRTLTLEDFEVEFADRHLLHGNVEHWALETPDALAIVETETGREITYQYFDGAATALAMKLLDLGFRKGDFLATSLPLIPQHIFLEYACFKIGVIFAPLDLRLKGAEVVRSLSLIQAKGFVFLGETPVADFRELGRLVQSECSFVEHLIQFSAPEETIEGALSVFSVMSEIMPWVADPTNSRMHRPYLAAHANVTEYDPALVIYTTGSTGYPKPALLGHRGICCQNMCVTGSFRLDQFDRGLINVPPSHVACQAAQLMGCFFNGKTAYTMRMFDPKLTLENIQKYRIQNLGQIPAMFAMEWRVPDFDQYDLSSLEVVFYGGQAAPIPMIERIKQMCPLVASGLGITEGSGFVTYTRLDATTAELSSGIGIDQAITPITIRAPMNPDGSAGTKLPDGEIGEICVSGPQVFLGYVNDAKATRSTISTEGILYTGDVGYRDAVGFHYTGRSKLVIKPKGYQVFPAQVEEHFTMLSKKVSACGAIGAPHEIYSEGIVLFVERHQGAELTVEELLEHSKGIAAYMRPSHFEILDPGHFPLNRVAKTDYLTLKERAAMLIEELRSRGSWDK